MARNLAWFILTVAAALLQTTWPDLLKPQGVVPDLVLALVVYLGLTLGEERAMFTGMIGGIYLDVASNTVLGHHVLCLVVLGYAVGRFSTRLLTDHPAVKMGLVFGAGLAHGLIYVGIAFVQDPGTRFFQTVLASVVPGAFYTALIAPIVFAIYGWFFQRRPALPGAVA